MTLTHYPLMLSQNIRGCMMLGSVNTILLMLPTPKLTHNSHCAICICNHVCLIITNNKMINNLSKGLARPLAAPTVLHSLRKFSPPPQKGCAIEIAGQQCSSCALSKCLELRLPSICCAPYDQSSR